MLAKVVISSKLSTWQWEMDEFLLSKSGYNRRPKARSTYTGEAINTYPTSKHSQYVEKTNTASIIRLVQK